MDASNLHSLALLRKGQGRVVVKVGTSSLTDTAGRIDEQRVAALGRGIAAIEQATGLVPVIVSSGAGAAGRGRLGLQLPLTLPEKQAAAAVGQTLLMTHWQRALEPEPVAQLLLSAGDVHDRERYVNAKHALHASLKAGAIPIINENDSVATAELKLGDNDTLSAWVAYLVDASLLIILTDVDGLYDADPRKHPDAKLRAVIDDLDEAQASVDDGHGAHGTGGMLTKLKAAAIAKGAGIPTLIMGGGGEGLVTLANGKAKGTFVPVPQDRAQARKAWLAQQPVQGRITIDAGAALALQDGKSLLPRGITRVEGAFAFGDAVEVATEEGQVIARGLTNYASTSLATIAGRHSREIAELLGSKDFDEAIHRDNLTLRK